MEDGKPGQKVMYFRCAAGHPTEAPVPATIVRWGKASRAIIRLEDGTEQQAAKDNLDPVRPTRA